MAAEISTTAGADSGPVRGRIFRPGEPFSPVELQALHREGLLRPAAAGSYADNTLPRTAAVRAAAAAALLSPTLRSAGALCGQTAAWAYLDRHIPQHIGVITADFFRRPAADTRWRIHQLPLAAGETRTLGGVSVTTPLRTAADVFAGTGTAGEPGALDLLTEVSPRGQGVARRWGIIAELAAHQRLCPEQVAEAVMRRFSRGSHDRTRARRIGRLLREQLPA